MNDTTVLSAVAFFPTLCGLTGVRAPAGVKFDGEGLSAAWRGGKQPRATPLLWQHSRKPAPTGRGKIHAFLHPAKTDAKSPNVAIRDGDWKSLLDADGPGAELCDLATDPNKTRNVAPERRDRAQRLTDAALA